MPGMNIYFNEEMYNIIKNKNIDNLSSLISDLLKEHFNTAKPLKEIQKEALEKSEKLLDEANRLEPIIEKEKEEKDEMEKEQLANHLKLQKEKRERNKEKARGIMEAVFITYNIPEEKIQDELDEFFEIMEGGLEIRPVQFLADKGYTKKEKFVAGERGLE